MPPKKFFIAAVLEYDAESIEAFIQIIETVIDTITRNKSARFFLKVAVNELIVNAVEHGYNKHSGPVSVFLLKQSDSVVLEVSDSGVGIHPELLNLEKTIESYDDLTVRGWGLSILKKVSSRFNIQANRPSGTTISLTLPLNFNTPLPRR